MIQILKTSDFKVMPWKNGLGTTSQIDIFPKDADFPGDDFMWRLSTATLRTSSPFSKFEGYERLLAVWQGNGLILDGSKIHENEILRFSGDQESFGELIDEEVLDLGLIFKKDQVEASMTFASTLAGQTLELFLDHQVHYVFCSGGSFTLENHLVNTGECARVENMKSISVSAAQDLDLKIFLIQVSLR